MLIADGPFSSAHSVTRFSASRKVPVWTHATTSVAVLEDVSALDHSLIIYGPLGARVASVLNSDGNVGYHPGIDLRIASGWRFDDHERIFSFVNWASETGGGVLPDVPYKRSFDVEREWVTVQQAGPRVTLSSYASSDFRLLWSHDYPPPGELAFGVGTVLLSAAGWFMLLSSSDNVTGIDFGCGPTGRRAVTMFASDGTCLRSIAWEVNDIVQLASSVAPDGVVLTRPQASGGYETVIEHPDGGTTVLLADAGLTLPPAVSRRTGAIYVMGSGVLRRLR